MKVVVIGPGRIGCGFVGELARMSGYDIVFVGRDRAVVDHLNRLQRYEVRLVSRQEVRRAVVDGVRALCTDDPGVGEEIATADLVATAVGARNLPQVAPLIASGLVRCQGSLTVLAFENLGVAGAQIRDLVATHLPAGFPLGLHGFSGALVGRAVTQRIGSPSGGNPLVFVGDPYSTFIVDGRDLHPPVPTMTGMVVGDDYLSWVHRKLYTFSAGHAATAYLGYLKGYHYIHTAIRDPEIRAAVLEAMREGQRGLAARYGRHVSGDESDLMDILARFENAALNDPVWRVGRDPRRKLGAEDRLIGAGQLAQEAGVNPSALAMAAAAALCCCSCLDSSADLEHDVECEGLGTTLSRVTGLDPSQGFGQVVANMWASLAQGWGRYNLLLSLKHMLWAWRPEQVAGAPAIVPVTKGETLRLHSSVLAGRDRT